MKCWYLPTGTLLKLDIIPYILGVWLYEDIVSSSVVAHNNGEHVKTTTL